jgi:hypothetical protein
MKILLSAVEPKDATIYSICLHRIFLQRTSESDLDSKFLACSERCGASMELVARSDEPAKCDRTFP